MNISYYYVSSFMASLNKHTNDVDNFWKLKENIYIRRQYVWFTHGNLHPCSTDTFRMSHPKMFGSRAAFQTSCASTPCDRQPHNADYRKTPTVFVDHNDTPDKCRNSTNVPLRRWPSVVPETWLDRKCAANCDRCPIRCPSCKCVYRIDRDSDRCCRTVR